MAKIVKTNKKSRKRISMLPFSVTIFMVSAILYLAGSLFVHQYNNKLTSTKQDLERNIAAIQKQNEAIAVEIEELASIDRINEIAAADDISHIQDNIITINVGEAAEEE